jgi:hypothetical protein
MSEPEAKARFKRGDVREDGRRFWQYLEKGTIEVWVTPESFIQRNKTIRKWAENNRDKTRANCRKWKEKNPEKADAATRRWREKNPQKIQEYKPARDAWWDKNRDKMNAHRRVKNKKRRANDRLFAFAVNLRTRMNNVFRLQKMVKPLGFGVILGTTLENARKHLEDQFKPGMSWENYGEWHVDHVIPLASAKDIDEIVALCHFTNLQPLWQKENLSKGARMPGA